MRTKILLIAGMCVSTGPFAGGYRVALQGQNALGMGHTGVAMTESSEVVFFNPAGMSYLQANTNISAGLSFIDSVTKFQSPPTNASAETNNPTGTPISLYLSQKHNEKLSYGMGIYTPYGNVIEWQKDWQGSHLVNNISLKTIFVQPTISYKINNIFSVGAGPVYVNGSVEFNRNLSSALIDADGERSNVTVKATGVNAWGYNIGFLTKPIEPLSVGVAFRSRVTMKANNKSADFENIPSSLQSTYTDTTFDAELILPAELTLGVAYNINSSTVLAIDINRTYWSAYKNLNITFNNGLDPALNPRNYSDTNIYRAGVQYKLNNTLTIRGGAYFDNSPIKNGYFTPETPRNDSIGLTVGAGYQITKRLGLDASLLYLMFDEFSASYDFVDHDNDSSTPNTSFKAEYKTSVTTIGFGLNYKY